MISATHPVVLKTVQVRWFGEDHSRRGVVHLQLLRHLRVRALCVPPGPGNEPPPLRRRSSPRSALRSAHPQRFHVLAFASVIAAVGGIALISFSPASADAPTPAPTPRGGPNTIDLNHFSSNLTVAFGALCYALYEVPLPLNSRGGGSGALYEVPLPLNSRGGGSGALGLPEVPLPFQGFLKMISFPSRTSPPGNVPFQGGGLGLL